MRFVTRWLLLSLTAVVSAGADDRWAFRAPELAQPFPGIDKMIHAELEKAGVPPSPQADKRTIIRRATWDLTGQPPSPEEVATFENDPSPDAYPRLIERLLASPHYGEQWARHWLDVVRYSDTKGYVYAREEKRWVHASPYRDWVVRALNDDLPYDRFLLLQIAADQLVPGHSPDLAAMGFLTLGRRFLGVTHDIIDDRIDVVMSATQGLTVACARCHDHKFDPIPTRDYYSLYGVFQSSAEAVVPCSARTNPKVTEMEAKARALLTQRREEQMKRVRDRVADHLFAQWELEKYPEETFGQLLSADDLNPFIVRRWQNWLHRKKLSSDPAFAAWHAFYTAPERDYPVVWQQLQKGGIQSYPVILQIFATAPRTRREVAERYAEALKHESLRHVLDGEDSPAHVPDEHIANIENYFPNNIVVELWKSQGDLDRLLLADARTPAYATILRDRPQPSTPRIFTRGNPLTKGDEVPRQFLSALGSGKPFTHGSGRLELARSIASPQNPLTARVMVNRLWQHHFGRGIVRTPSDFGKQGTPPTHPALLDALAAEFIRSGWSLKSMHRLMMLSRTYQQSSEGPEDPAALAKAQQVDADNRLLWRMNAHRLSFEEARDAWLVAAGKLDRTIGGRPLSLLDTSNHRRTLYAMIDREALPPTLRVFDFANPDLSIPQRSETIVPQQALFGLNHPFVVSQAKLMVQRVLESGEDPVSTLYQLLLQRQPTEPERRSAQSFVSDPAPQPPLAAATAKDWKYGYGEFDDAAGRLKSFTPLPHFTGSAWQGDDAWPGPKLGWAQLNASGGHPGNTRAHAVARRWIAPAEGTYDVASTLIHVPDVGDGIRAFISHSRLGKLRSAKLHAGEADLSLQQVEMKAGETLDFVVDINVGLNSDQFLWAPVIRSTSATTGSGGDLPGPVWQAEKDFDAAPRTRLSPWEQFAQVLMLSNEFLFVD